MAETIAFQPNMNYFASEEDMTSSNWVKDILTNSSKAELNQRVDEKFYNLDPLRQGGITYLKFFLDEMFCMTNDIVTSLQTFLKTFAEEVLSNTVGENVLEDDSYIKEVSERLSEVNQLPLEAPTYVLQGLTKCSFTEFTDHSS